MAKIAIAGSSTGTATYTIQSPSGSTDRVLTLPDEAGTVLTSATAASSIPGYGSQITEIDTWVLTTNLTISSNGASTILSSNLARVSNSYFTKKGTGVSQSSGEFSFPSTGLWEVCFGCYYRDTDDDNEYIENRIHVTNDNGSSWFTLGYAINHVTYMSGSTVYGSGFVRTFINITNTSTQRVRFHVDNSNSVLVQGDANRNVTYMTFVKLGDSV